MGIPGSNLLRQARKVIKFNGIKYVKFEGKTLDDQRDYVNNYAEPVDLQASVQAVQLDKYQELGLDLQHKYIKIWASENLIDLDRDYSGDKFVWNREEYQLVGDTNWFLQDGWASALGVKIGRVQ